MLVSSLIKDVIPPLKITDTGERALAWMEEFRLRYLPVIRNQDFLGIISESDVMGLGDRKKALEHFTLPFERVFVYDNQHVYDAVKFVSNYNFSVVPVLDSEQHYAGLISVMDIIDSFSELYAVKSPGGIIELEINQNDYSLSEIAQLVEANDGSIMSLHADPSADQTKINVTIKVNILDLSRILAAFYRYNYNVTAYYQQNEFSADLQNRYESFMNYLKM
ncbi:MAG: CBS domain-containing protein [Bacteroidia bacterium]